MSMDAKKARRDVVAEAREIGGVPEPVDIAQSDAVDEGRQRDGGNCVEQLLEILLN